MLTRPFVTLKSMASPGLPIASGESICADGLSTLASATSRPFKRLLLQFVLKTTARENRQVWILGKPRICEGKFAKVEDRTLRRFNPPRMKATAAESSVRLTVQSSGRIRHAQRIAHRLPTTANRQPRKQSSRDMHDATPN